MLKINMKSSQAFVNEINIMMNTGNFETHIEAIVHFCEKNNMDIETAAALLKNSHKIKALLQEEGEAVSLLQKSK